MNAILTVTGKLKSLSSDWQKITVKPTAAHRQIPQTSLHTVETSDGWSICYNLLEEHHRNRREYIIE